MLAVLVHDSLKKERVKTFKQTSYGRYIYQNELDKSCFKHDVTYGNFKDYLHKS